MCSDPRSASLGCRVTRGSQRLLGGIDGRWELIAANAAADLLTSGAAPALLEPPVNVLRLSLHPDGIAPRILNLPEWRAHLLDRLDRESPRLPTTPSPSFATNCLRTRVPRRTPALTPGQYSSL
jgi:hypothetical protein